MAAQVVMFFRVPTALIRQESKVFLRSNVNKSVTKVKMKFLPEVEAGNLSAHALLTLGNNRVLLAERSNSILLEYWYAVINLIVWEAALVLCRLLVGMTIQQVVVLAFVCL